MSERTIPFKGQDCHINGPQLKPGDKAPDAVLVTQTMDEAKLSDWAGKPRVISVILSVDTGVCDTQIRRFNEEAGKIGGVSLLTVTVDLPYAMKRWCGAAGLDVTLLSDYRHMAFGDAYGVHVVEPRILQRSVFVVDRNDVIRYAEYLPAIGQQPNYEAALAAAREVAG